MYVPLPSGHSLMVSPSSDPRSRMHSVAGTFSFGEESNSLFLTMEIMRTIIRKYGMNDTKL